MLVVFLLFLSGVFDVVILRIVDFMGSFEIFVWESWFFWVKNMEIGFGNIDEFIWCMLMVYF